MIRKKYINFRKKFSVEHYILCRDYDLLPLKFYAWHTMVHPYYNILFNTRSIINQMQSMHGELDLDVKSNLYDSQKIS